jgi:hypothetical protein
VAANSLSDSTLMSPTGQRVSYVGLAYADAPWLDENGGGVRCISWAA